MRLWIYNTQGHHMATLIDSAYVPGRHVAILEAEGLPSGVYLYFIEVGIIRDDGVGKVVARGAMGQVRKGGVLWAGPGPRRHLLRQLVNLVLSACRAA